MELENNMENTNLEQNQEVTNNEQQPTENQPVVSGQEF